MTESEFYGMLGLARRSGNLAFGTDAVLSAVRGGKAELVVISCDCSENTAKKLVDKCSFYETEYITFGTSEKLGKATGNDNSVALAITDKNFADAILDIYNNLTEVAENGSC